jgi:hypothetical protein
MNETPMSDAVAKPDDKTIAVRAQREKDLYTLWKTTGGQRQVLNLLWTVRDSKTPLRAGESVIQLILEHEFGPLRA